MSDRKTIENFTQTVQTIERLRYLLILTVCDIRAVGPGVWNGWKGQLLRTLYDESEPLLTGGFSNTDRSDRVHQARELLASGFGDWREDETKRLLTLPYDSYFLSTDPAAQLRHMNFIKNTDENSKEFAYDIHVREFEQITEISVLAPDHPHLLSAIAGVCASANANIAGAQIHTLRDGRALDTILVNREFDSDEDELRRGRSIGEQIGETLSGKAALKPESIVSKTLRSRRKTFKIDSKVLIDNELSNKFTVLEVEGLDRHGLLAELADELSNLNLDIGSAHIVTFGEKAVDTFYVTDLTGLKIVDKVRKARIRKALLKIMG